MAKKWIHSKRDSHFLLAQGRSLARLAPNVVVKIPVTNAQGESCLGVIHSLSREGIAVNTTAILSFNQAILAAKAGAAYVSIFAGRIADEGNDPSIVIRNVRNWLTEWEYTAKIIVGSIRAVIDIQAAALAGAHIITIPPQFLPKMVDHKYTRETVSQFNRDAARALEQMSEARAAAAASGSSPGRHLNRCQPQTGQLHGQCVHPDFGIDENVGLPQRYGVHPLP